MEESPVLLVGPAAACATAVATLTASPLLAECAIREVHNLGQALALLSADESIAATVILYGQDDPARLPALVTGIQEQQRNPLMALTVRSDKPLPAEIAGQLWNLGVTDRQFSQPTNCNDFAESIAIALREVVRHRVHYAIADSAVRLARTQSLGELAALALRILGEQKIGRRGTLFCFLRNTAEPQLLAVTGTGIYAAADCLPVEQIGDEQARRFIETAWAHKASRFTGNMAALYVGSPAQAHPALILLAFETPLLPWQRCLLESFANAIAPVVEESQLAHQLVRTQRAMISTLATLAEYKDTDTGEHVARVARITAEIASYLKQSAANLAIDEPFLEHIGHASILHDLGKVAIPERVLLKAGALDAAEREIINNHVVIGHEILKKAAALAAHGEARLFGLASEIALAHHERYDGKGYPLGLKGDEIPLSARIVAVVDVFDALISHRPYKQPWSVERALDLIRDESGRHFDPQVVAAFIAVHERKSKANYIRWTETMSVGNAELDRDHKRLIGILNHLGINIELGNRNIVEFILDDLSDYAQVHFRREENHLARLNFPDLERHRRIHDGIAHRIEDAKWKYFQGLSATLENELLNFLTAWLNNHILVEDMKYSRLSGAAQAEPDRHQFPEQDSQL